MNHILSFISLFLLICMTPKSNHIQSSNTLRENLIGEWTYQYSYVNGNKMVLETTIHCPTYKMVFKKCIDENKLKSMPKSIKVMRQENLFKNLYCYTYDNKGEIIDLYYPVARILNDSLPIIVSNYGLKYKSEYIIDKLVKDTLIIHDNRSYLIEGKEISFVQHVYVRL